MCLAYRIKQVPNSPFGLSSIFVPCGKCEECRKAIKNAWGFRLRAELENCIKNKFNTMFFTLTYSDEKIPRIGWDCFTPQYKQTIDELMSDPILSKDDCLLIDKVKRIANLPCFSREHIEKFVHALREWLWRDYDIKDVAYFIAGEFGSHTRRPHYHGLLSLPPCVDPEKVFEFIKKHWTPFGHVFPRYYEGGLDSHGYSHKPFVVRSPLSAARYCAKYATKDLYYSDFLLDNGLTDKVIDVKSREFKRKMVFHVQKKSLGACILVSLSDKDKISLYTIGYAFADDDKMSPIPVYIRNKLVFDNNYIYKPATIAYAKGDKELGEIALSETYMFKRLVRRKANDFFKTHIKEIFEYKVKTYKGLFERFCDYQQYVKRGISPEFIDYGLSLMAWLQNNYTMEELAQWYLLYDGVDQLHWYYVEPKDYYLLYLLRYTENFNEVDYPIFRSYRIELALCALRMVVSCFYLNPLSRSEAQKLEDRIADFFKSHK